MSLQVGPPRASILIVDDEPKNLLALAEILSDLGTIVQARSGEEALRWLLRQDFAVLLLDVQMPGMDGYEVAQLVRRRERTRTLPIIFVTAHNREEGQVNRGYLTGAADYVFKPIDPFILRSKVQVFVELHNKTEEVRRQAEQERRLQLENLRVRAEKAEAEQALRRVEQRQDMIIRSLPIAFYTAEVDGSFRGPRFLSEGIERLTGFMDGRFVRDPDAWVDRIHEADRRRVLDAIATIEESGRVATEYRWRCADGVELHFLDQAVLVRDEDGRPREIFGTCLDVTERRQMEHQLVHAQKMEALGQLTGGIAHDFNNMLTVVIGNLDMLGRSLKDRQGAYDRAQTALSGALSCAELTRRLLAFARRQPLQPRAIDFADTIPGMAELLNRTLGEKIEVETRIQPGLWRTLADAAQVESTLMNLAINARDAMPDGGRLVISAENVAAGAAVDELTEEAPRDFVMLTVADTGFGMPQEVAARVFEPFFTTKEAGRGTGLGLSMTYGFVKQSGGHIFIDSTVGVGTAIRIYLPRTERRAERAALGTMPAIGPANGRTVLIVEDDREVRRTTVALLKELGYAVREAGDAAEALTLLGTGPVPDLLFSDVVMPGGLSGFDLARQARARHPDLKVLLTSGYSEAFRTAVETNLDVLQKPFRATDLAGKLTQILDPAAPLSAAAS